MRRNGFFANGRVSLNLHQLAAGTAYVALLVAFYATQSPVFANAGTRAGLEIAFAVMTCFVLVLFAKAAGTDPGDVGGGTHVSGTHGVGVGVDANDDDPQTSPEMLFCDLCAKDVSHGSKHCRTCDKCVKHFDHHCVWLNNCVGSKNYHSFLVLVFGTFLQVVGQLVIGAYLTHGAVTKKDDTNETLRRNGVFLTRQTWLVCSTCVMLFGFVTAYVLGDLLGFHFILNKRGLTTLEFISASRDKGEDTTANEPTTGGDGCGSDAKGGAFCGKTWSCMRKQCRNGTAKVVPDVVSSESGENAHRGSDPRGGRKKRKRVKIACWALFNSDAKPKPKKREADVERASAPEENPGR